MSMKCLLDGDVLVYEAAFGGQYKDEEGELVVRPFESVAELLDQKIREIVDECWADEEPLLFLTNDSTLNKMYNRRRKQDGLEPVTYIPNFRIDVAKDKPYKGQRKQDKPFHRDNVRAYMLDNYECVVANGVEADDMLAVYQTKAAPLTTVICSRDKDLKMVEGMHYTWACAKQPQWGPAPVDKLGELQLNGNKLTGTGSKFFYSQVLTGDSTDNYSGLPRCGPKRAFELLEGGQSERDLFQAVSGAYRDKFGDDWRAKMLEQARLAWMVVELDSDGEPVMWEINEEWLSGTE